MVSIKQLEEEVKDLDEILWNGTGLIRLSGVCGHEAYYSVNIIFPEDELPISKELKKYILEYFNNLKEKCSNRVITYTVGEYKQEIIFEFSSGNFFDNGTIPLGFTLNGCIKDETFEYPILYTNYTILAPILYALHYALDKLEREILINKIENSVGVIPKEIQFNLKTFCEECEGNFHNEDFRIFEFSPEDIFYSTIGFEPFSLQKFFKEENEIYDEIRDYLHHNLESTLDFCNIKEDEKTGKIRVYAVGSFTDDKFTDYLKEAIGEIFTMGGYGLDYIGDERDNNDEEYHNETDDFFDYMEYDDNLCLFEILESYEDFPYYKVDDK